ncbi:hypothetical protein [Thermogemmatispora sp.]|uniref:pPIWI_RE_Z domain-containing protein n=1 Tax=Thermogemmatispora sp. TaxID=1968838 RepID=UPI0035E445A6
MRAKPAMVKEIEKGLKAALAKVGGRSEAGKPAGQMELTIREIVEVELGLTLLSELAPGSSARSLWALLTGYSFPLPASGCPPSEKVRMVSIARHLLLPFKSPRRWEQALARYCKVSERLRLYDVDLQTGRYCLRAVSLYPERQALYAQLYRQPVPHVERKLRMATAGRYRCSDGRRRVAVTIADDLPLPGPPQGYQLPRRDQHPALTISWEELIATAGWMDEEEARRGLPPRHWRQTLERVRLCLSPTEDSPFCEARELVLQGTLHLVGMVGAGKTTLMDVLAVWAARQRRRVALVVGDVTSLLERVQYFHQLGLSAAPVLGATNRSKHRRRLHQILSTVHGVHPLLHEHIGLDYTGTACLLDGFRREESRPFRLDPRPCLALRKIREDEEEEEIWQEEQLEGEEGEHVGGGGSYACPFYAVCPYHLAQHELVEAAIWVATPQSLIYTSVDPQLCPSRLRFLELVYRLCDLVVVDEADRVQVQLDELFNPSLTLVSQGGDSWLGKLFDRVSAALYRAGLGQVSDDRVLAWVKKLHSAQQAALNLYGLLLGQPALRSWIEEQRSYFSAFTLLEKLTIAVCGLADSEQPYSDKRYQEFWQALALFLDDPLGEYGEHELADLARQSINLTQQEAVRERLCRWLERQPHVCLDRQELTTWALRLQFALMLEVLADSLDTLIRDWRQVEALFGLEGSSTALFYSPPPDYAPWLPDAPMGNILGFQYVHTTDQANGPGELRFFRCIGVGRWLLLHLHDFLAAENLAGPHVVLLSGTSWAGSSPIYHLQLPVHGVLLPPQEELEAIAQSQFAYCFSRDERTQEAIAISGKQGQARLLALENLVWDLAHQEHLGQQLLPSRLERLRASLPEDRQRILLVVGSYQEAEHVYRALVKHYYLAHGQVAYLVPDDAEFEHSWSGHNDGLQRGMVSRFSSREAWLLVAPLQAIERGHNILTDEGKAAIGAVCFLVRPHPRPDDIQYTLHAMNYWAIQHDADQQWWSSLYEAGFGDLEALGKRFRGAAFAQWQHLLRTPLRYSSLPLRERQALIWSLLVAIWQVIGRLVRGGCPARVLFCDKRFAPRQATYGEDDRESSSLIVGMLSVLGPYFDPESPLPQRDKHLVHILYGPLYQGLKEMQEKGLSYE